MLYQLCYFESVLHPWIHTVDQELGINDNRHSHVLPNFPTDQHDKVQDQVENADQTQEQPGFFIYIPQSTKKI